MNKYEEEARLYRVKDTELNHEISRFLDENDWVPRDMVAHILDRDFPSMICTIDPSKPVNKEYLIKVKPIYE